MLKNRLLLVILHLLLGGVMTISILPKIITMIILIYAVVDIVSNKNDNNQAFLWTSYFVSAEVLLRMTGGTISWEMVKYITILFLFIGIVVEKKSNGVPIIFWLYILLLLVGVAFTEIPPDASLRKAVIFNLSGPITLGVSAIYFYKRAVEYERFKEVLFFALLPIFSMLTLLYFRTPSIKEITFGTSANFETSGGFGPNQVATALGFGIFLMASLLLLKGKITGSIYVDVFLLFYLIYRGLLTFSRGGIITGVLAFFVLSIFYLIAMGKVQSFFKYIGILMLFTITIWVYSTNATGGMLENRYLGENTKGEQKADMSSGRLDIFAEQMETFKENPIFGIGVGSGKYLRLEKYDGHVTGASHNEMSRLLEEHGLIGLLALILLIVSSGINFFKQPIIFKGFVVAFASLWFLTINHSAMRVAFPGFIYGLSLIHLYVKEETTDDLETEAV